MIRGRSQAQALHELVKFPVLISTLGIAYYCGSITSWQWFSFHPVAMVIGSMTIPPLGALIKKIGGYENTKLHGNMFIISMALMLFGFYVIYTNKNLYGKFHIQTTHAKLGLFTLVGFVPLLLAGFFGLHPHYGALKTNKNLRLVHRLGSRFIILLGLYTCYTGFAKIEENTSYVYAFLFTCLLLVPLVL